MDKNIIHIENICFSYESEMILKHLSMNVESNRIFFIMGNNGSGKTTLLKNVMGIIFPQVGKIQISNVNVSAISKRAMSRLVSYVPQAIHLNTDFSVIDYLSFGRTPYIGLMNKLSDEDYDIIERFSVRFGIDTIYGTAFNKLSGGQKQMVAIARSLIQDTPLLVLDEPMSALDIGKQVDLLKIFNELIREGKTIVLTTHNPNHALSFDSDACFLKNGEIVACGKSKEIISKELLNNIYGENITLDHGEMTDSVVFNVGLTC